ncbi:MAG: class I SAM-dependent methyltransferase [Olleya sp.]
MKSNVKYIHTSRIHNMAAPRIIVKHILEFINPKSVVDFGCGVGTFLKAFTEKNINNVLGLDGPWADKNLMANYLELENFKEVDLEKEIILDQKYDLAISLEVAEHLSESSADTLVKNLIQSSDVILFSAAIPFQGGQNHVNEQFVDYWENKFLKHQFVFIDVIRSKIWNEKEVNWWYKQNTFLVINKEKLSTINLGVYPLVNNTLIHPDHYIAKNVDHKNFRLGKGRTKVYIKLVVKSILYKLKLI